MTQEKPERIEFSGCENNLLVGDMYAAENSHGLVLLAHGGGQTRHSWGGTARAMAERGISAVTLDQRGHGDSEWVPSGNYEFSYFADDLSCVTQQLQEKFGHKPAVVGASLGGLAGLFAGGKDGQAFTALVLVDITPKMKVDGVARIVGFMCEHAEEGFATVEEAADAIAAYLPHRPKPSDLSGLSKNLRLDDDGRYRWHWDPNFILSRQDYAHHTKVVAEEGFAAARNIKMPVLLVRGLQSELVGEDEVKDLIEAIPHAEFADIVGARHMVAGDKNDIFTDTLLDFFDKLTWR